MTPLPHPDGRRPVILIAGGGVAAVETLLALHALAGDRVELRLVSASPWFTYRPLAVEEAFGRGPAPKFSLKEICDEHAVELHDGTVVQVAPEHGHVFTHDGAIFSYDALVIAVGAQRHAWLHEAATLYGPGCTDRIAGYLREARSGEIGSIGCVVPANTSWSLPLYELALLTRMWARRQNVDLAVKLMTPEARPLEVFGGQASDAVGELLDQEGVELHLGAEVALESAATIDADRLITLPRLTGPAIRGLATDDEGFVRVDQSGRMAGQENIYAAGDGTTAPIKQGGLASQQADTVAEHLAARLGAISHHAPVQGTLRAVLLTGEEPLYLRADVDLGGGSSRAARHPLWWPPAKVAASYLSDYLYERGPVGDPANV
jgi:sulfide:quinone oxidoreductase